MYEPFALDRLFENVGKHDDITHEVNKTVKQ